MQANFYFIFFALLFFCPGIAYDFRNDLYFWIIEGGQGPLYLYNKTSKDTLLLQESLDRPVSLAADWVAKRLFWVQDGNTVSYTYVCMYSAVHKRSYNEILQSLLIFSVILHAIQT